MNVEGALTGGDGTETRLRADLQSKLEQPRVRHVAVHRNLLDSNSYSTGGDMSNGWDASNSFSAVAEYLVIINTHQENKCVLRSSVFERKSVGSWDCALLLLCCLGARRPYVIVAANVPVQRGL